MSSTATMMRRMPSVFTGACSGSALTAAGVWNLSSSIRPWPSGVRVEAMVARTPSAHHRSGRRHVASDRTQSTYWSGVTRKPSGSSTPVAWFGQ
jgi:hypothetical protein